MIEYEELRLRLLESEKTVKNLKEALAIDTLKEEISDVKAKLASGEQPVFDSVDALFDKLEAE